MPQTHERSVFADPSGRRARRAARLAGVGLFLLLVLGAGFLVSVLIPARLPTTLRAKRFRPKGIEAPNRRDAAYAAQIERPVGRPEPPKTGRRTVGAYLPMWTPAAVSAFENRAKNLTVVYPTWLTLKTDGTVAAETSSGPESVRRVAEVARRNGVALEPVLANASGGNFAPAGVLRMLGDPPRAQAAIAAVASRVRAEGWEGVQIDFEGLGAKDELRLAVWLRHLKAAIAPARLSLAMEVETEPKAARALAAAADAVVVMAYDENDEFSEPGPIASLGFVRDALALMLENVPREKVVLGIGTYAYDWRLPHKEGGPKAEALTYDEAITAAAGYRDEESPQEVAQFDPQSRNSWFEYTDDAGSDHEVWIQNAASVYNAVRAASPLGIQGVALWSLGGEDAGIWPLIGKEAPGPNDLEEARVTDTVGAIRYTGDGEILQVQKEESRGRREFAFDANGFVKGITVTAFPTGTLVHRSGARKGTVALTFDDGPDPTWTPQILDILKENAVPGTFFVIGQSAARDPNLVRRMVDEGHEVGSHSFSHPNLGVVGPERVRLELDAAQRAIQAATGRSTVLFRPPYNADSTPQTQVEMAPVAAASSLGYLTVGESVDPEDWLLKTPAGVPRTGEEMAQEAIRGVEKGGDGAAILLHDGGGDRTETLVALREIIPALKAKGYRFVSVGGLLGLPEERIMPPLGARQRALVFFDTLGFRLSGGFERLLALAFGTAIVLGAVRSILVTLLAVVAARRAKARWIPAAEFAPPVEVLVAAYNEERTIARTIASLLASDYPHLRVLVVDDGSKDDTSGVVEREFGDDPRVRLVKKPNGGKASALNLALESATAPIVVGVDADTQLPPDAIRRLVAPLADPEVGMTAGNVKVGNAHNAVTEWQDVEYTTSQNLDRRAYSLLNCVTVVPGAIGAWRREAVMVVGAYQTDTLAEDMDLTWRMRRAGWRAETVPEARAYTEAPETVRAFFKQRFRWTFGTLQCLWKHRSALGRYAWFGGFALPSLWIFQIVLQIIAPLVDLQVLWSLFALGVATFDPVPPATTREWNPQSDAFVSLSLVLGSAAAFLLLEIVSGFIAYRMDGESPRPLLWLPLQRFVYRQIMYLVVWNALLAAFRGARTGWGKLERTARVRLGASG